MFVESDFLFLRSKKKLQTMKQSSSHEALFMRRLSAEGAEMGGISVWGMPGHASPVTSSPIRSPPFKHDSSGGDDTVRYGRKFFCTNISHI